MKKIVLFLTSLTLMGASLVSCGEDTQPFELTYKTAVDALHQINYKLLSSKINSEQVKESFILLTYDSDSPGCSCWLDFYGYLRDHYVPETKTLFYYMGTAELKNQEEKFNINVSPNQPTICFFNKGKLVKQYDYGNNKSLFKDPSGEYSEFKRVMKQFTTQQNNLFLFDKYENVVQEMPKMQKGVFYAFRTTCPDCQYSSSKVLIPYLAGKTLSTKIYLLDVDKYKILDDKTVYQNVMTALKLTDATENWGYLTGKVPTFQYWENGQIKDANVFFNDVVNLVDNKYYITDSFFTEERQNKLSYLDNVQTKVLKGLELSADQIEEFGGNYYRKADNALVYHQPLLDAFLNKYAK